MNKEIDYKAAGVDVEAGYMAVKLMKEHVEKTYDKNVLGGIGSFGGFYALSDDPNGDVLVAGTDGVGTKLKYAFVSNKHDTIGIDVVAMCVNDIVCLGAKPLIFLDYIAISKLLPEKIEQIVKGVSDGCVQAGCALIGGETAEMPGFYAEDEYDIAGFSCGIAKRNKIINGENIVEGDVLIGLKSSGIHSNGYSLVRQIFKPDDKAIFEYDAELDAVPIDVLLTPTRIYVKTILELIKSIDVKGIAHITGGGFIENLPRILPKGLKATVNTKAYEIPKYLKFYKKSRHNFRKMYNTFNMGIGMAICVKPSDVEKTIETLKVLGEDPVVFAAIEKGEGVSFI